VKAATAFVSLALLAGCGRHDCDPATVLPLPTTGTFPVVDIRIEDSFDGGGSRSAPWGAGSPWDDVQDLAIELDGPRAFVTYRTPEGRFRVELERASPTR